MPLAKLPVLDLPPDRTDAVPTDPDTHEPSNFITAEMMNKLISHTKLLEEQHNFVVAELAALRNEQKEQGNSYPPLLHRFIFWGRNANGAKPGFIPDATAKPQRVLFAGAPDWNSYGVAVRPTGPTGPQYAYVDVPDLNMTQNLAVFALVRDTASGPDGGAYVAVASSESGRSYLTAYRDASRLGVGFRTVDDSVITSSFATTGSGGIPFTGSGWKLIEVSKGSNYVDVIDHTRREAKNDDFRSFHRFNDGVTAKFAVTGTRIAVGIIPRKLDAGELKGLGHCTLGGLFVSTRLMSEPERHQLYLAIRQQMQQDNVSDLLPAPAA